MCGLVMVFVHPELNPAQLAGSVRIQLLNQDLERELVGVKEGQESFFWHCPSCITVW